MIGTRHPLRVMAIVFVALLVATPTLAANGPGFSGAAAGADSVVTIESNPAGMTLLPEGGYAFSSVFAYSESDFRLTSSTLGGQGDDKNTSFSVIPAFDWVRPLSDRWWLGTSVSGQGGLGTSYDDNWAGRYFLQEWSMFYVGVTPSLAYRVNDRVSLAAGASLTYAAFSQESAVFNPEPGLGDGELELDTDDLAFGYSLSGLFRAGKRTRFGLSYRSEIEPSLEDVPDFRGLGPTRQAQLEQSGAFTREIGISTRLPQSILGGMHHRFDSGKAWTVDVVWLDFSAFELSQSYVADDSITTDTTDYDDIWAVSTGLRLPLRDPWELRFGAFYVSDAVDDANRTFLLRLDDAWGVGGGFERTLGERQILTVNLTYIEVGDAPVQTPDAPIIGQVTGRYDTRRTAMLDVVWAWRSKAGKRDGQNGG